MVQTFKTACLEILRSMRSVEDHQVIVKEWKNVQNIIQNIKMRTSIENIQCFFNTYLKLKGNSRRMSRMSHFDYL